jgi:uncharacterized protein (TIGR02391 family)
MLGFLQELFIARAAGHLTWRLGNQSASPQDASYYLEQIQDIALTSAGQDRARNQVVVLPPPDPDENDGHDLSDLILRQVADAITCEYAPDQVIIFLGEQGMPRGWVSLPKVSLTRSWPRYGVRARLDDAWSGTSSAAGWTASSSPARTASSRLRCVSSLHVRDGESVPDDSVLVAAEPFRGVPVSAPFLREARLHLLVEAEARPQFMIRKLDQAVFASLKAVEIRVRALGGYHDQTTGVDLVNGAFAASSPLTDSSAPKGEQDGTRALFAGAFGALRNPAGHRQVDYDDASEAAEAVQLPSLIMRILDRIQTRLVDTGRTAESSSNAP